MKIRILIVDDEETIRLSLKEALKDLGYSISTAATGTIALEKYSAILDLINKLSINLFTSIKGIEKSSQSKVTLNLINLLILLSSYKLSKKLYNAIPP